MRRKRTKGRIGGQGEEKNKRKTRRRMKRMRGKEDGEISHEGG
jgi:hypothetical protein